jgi:hypothetical protein
MRTSTACKRPSVTRSRCQTRSPSCLATTLTGSALTRAVIPAWVSTLRLCLSAFRMELVSAKDKCQLADFFCCLEVATSLSSRFVIGIEKHDNEGRVITAEYPSFYLINACKSLFLAVIIKRSCLRYIYKKLHTCMRVWVCVRTDVPNSGRGLPRLPYRSKEWDVDFRQYLKELDKKKPIILCGDLNVAHNEIGAFICLLLVMVLLLPGSRVFEILFFCQTLPIQSRTRRAQDSRRKNAKGLPTYWRRATWTLSVTSTLTSQAPTPTGITCSTLGPRTWAGKYTDIVDNE